MNNVLCKHCGDVVEEYVRDCHWTEGDGDGYGHNGLCCDCMDLSCGMPLDMLNKERAGKGKAPITEPWPGLDENGNRADGKPRQVYVVTEAELRELENVEEKCDDCGRTDGHDASCFYHGPY